MAKILIDGRFYGLEHAGLGRYTMGLVDNLVKSDKTNKYQIILRNKYFNALKIPSNWRKVKCDIKHYSLEEQIRLPAILSRLDYDIFHALNPNIPLLYLLINKLVLKRKLVVTVHDTTQLKTDLKATTLPLPYYYLKNFGYKILFREALVSSNAIITPTGSVKDEIVNTYNLKRKNVKAIHEGVGKVFAGSKEGNVLKKYKLTKPYFIYVGSAYPHKNIEKAIESLYLLNKKEETRVKFAIVSARSVFTKRIEYIANKHKMSKFVINLGYVPDKRLALLLANATAFVYSSLSEGFGLPGLEAMQAGTLLLASDIPVFREVYKDNATYFDPQDVDSIAKSMKVAINMGSNERSKRITKARDFTNKYSWKIMAKETIRVYNEILK